MADRTLDYYETHSAQLAARYESGNLSDARDRMARLFAPGARLLELGCGSGRDAAAMLARGYDVIAVDASAAMLAEAARLHPELAGRLRRHRLPDALPFAAAAFAGAYANALLMHLREPAIAAVLAEVARVVQPGGAFVFSVPSRRPGLGPDGTDEGGRFFNMLPDDRWKSLAAGGGFVVDESQTSADRLGRDGVSWRTYVARNGLGAGKGRE